MKHHVHKDDVERVQRKGHTSRELITEKHGAVKGYMIGVSEYTTEEYLTPGIHEDQEGFYVVTGEGKAKIGKKEFDIRPGSAFIAPKDMPHSIKKNPGSVPIKVVWSHGAV